MGSLAGAAHLLKDNLGKIWVQQTQTHISNTAHIPREMAMATPVQPERGKRTIVQALRGLWSRIQLPVGKGVGSTKGFPAEAAKVSGVKFNTLPEFEFDNAEIKYDNPTPSSQTIESAGANTIGARFGPASRLQRRVNILSPLAIEELVGAMIANAQILPVEVGWRSHRPEDIVKGWMTTLANVQMKVGVSTRAYWEMASYVYPGKLSGRTFDQKTGVYTGGQLVTDADEPELDDDGNPVLDKKGMPKLRKGGSKVEFTINIGHLFWRATHRMANGSYRLLPCFGDVSHQAEAYHKGEAWKWRRGEVEVVRPSASKGYQIQIVNLESHAWNELRKQCNAFGYAVRWGAGPKKGQFYTKGESIKLPNGEDDLSMCPHAVFGVPCFMPLPPAGERVPVSTVAQTPTKARETADFKSPKTGLLYDIHGLTPRRPILPTAAGPSTSTASPIPQGFVPTFFDEDYASPEMACDDGLPMEQGEVEAVPVDMVDYLIERTKRPRV